MAIPCVNRHRRYGCASTSCFGMCRRRHGAQIHARTSRLLSAKVRRYSGQQCTLGLAAAVVTRLAGRPRVLAGGQIGSTGSQTTRAKKQTSRVILSTPAPCARCSHGWTNCGHSACRCAKRRPTPLLGRCRCRVCSSALPRRRAPPSALTHLGCGSRGSEIQLQRRWREAAAATHTTTRM